MRGRRRSARLEACRANTAISSSPAAGRAVSGRPARVRRFVMTALKDIEVRSDDTLREEALERLKKRQDLRAHLLVYAMVMALLWTIWVLTPPRGFPWPAIVMFGWGIGVVMNVWDVYARKPFTEEEVEKEMQRLSGGSAPIRRPLPGRRPSVLPRGRSPRPRSHRGRGARGPGRARGRARSPR